MSIIDLHCDTIYEIHYASKEQDLYKSDLQVDIQKMRQSQVLAQTFALYMDSDKMAYYKQSPMEYAYGLKQTFQRQMDLNSSDIQYAGDYKDIVKNNAANKISALLAIEGGEVLQGEIDNLEKVYDWGVRALTLTWNHANELGDPHTLKGNLTSFGQEVVKHANYLGILLDVSHISDTGFWDVMALSKFPVMASHSNARAICNHSRNLTDEMIKAIANNGGIIGINLYGLFINGRDYSTLDDVIRHINHIYQVGGIETIAFGSDFDGFIGEGEVCNAAQWGKLIHRLTKMGIPQRHIDKITYENALRIIKDVL